ncbi:MAG: hypothetical protein AAGM38_12755 [Pseudomonadota bacterium]
MNDLRIEKLTRQGIALMQEEREAATKGDFGALEDLNRRKQAFLDEINALSQKLEGGGPIKLRAARRQELETLFEIMRRRAAENQALLRAAATGVRAAKRQIAELAASSEIIGAYTPSGEAVNASQSARKTNQLL